MIEKLTNEEMIATVAERYARHYDVSPPIIADAPADSHWNKYQQLLSLGKDRELIETFLGTNSWTSFRCECCNEDGLDSIWKITSDNYDSYCAGADYEILQYCEKCVTEILFEVHNIKQSSLLKRLLKGLFE